MTPPDRRGDGDVPPKGTFFCHECDHRSRYDGDWALAETERGTAHLCPECGATITVRPLACRRSARGLRPLAVPRSPSGRPRSPPARSAGGLTPFVRPALDADDADGRDGDLWWAWEAYSRAAVLVRRFTANACWRAASASLGNAKW